MKKLSLLLIFVSVSFLNFAQDKPCGQLPVVNPQVKAVCHSDIKTILTKDLPETFTKKSKHHGTFKLIVDCNGEINMVISKKGNLTPEEEKYFLVQINDLRDWTPAKVKGGDVSSTVYFTVDINNRVLTFKQF